MEIDISVIVCTYNRCEILRTFLEELNKLQYLPDSEYEIIIVDNNSNDQTRVAVENYIRSGRENVRYIFEGRQGKTFALNTGIREAKGRIIAFTDDDVIIDKEWLSSIRKAVEANPDCKAFAGKVIALWPDNIPAWVAKEGQFRNTGGAVVEHDLGDGEKSYSQEDAQRGMGPVGANMFFVRDIFEKYGGFNENLNLLVKKIPMLEDTDFCIRLLKKNEKILYAPSVTVYHPVYDDRLTKKYFRKISFKTGRAKYIQHNLQRSGRYFILNIRKNNRRLLNVPLYILYDSVIYLIKYIMVLLKCNPQEIFYYDKLLMYYAGMIYELYLQRKFKSDTSINPHLVFVRGEINGIGG